jgi:hypothetical protein
LLSFRMSCSTCTCRSNHKRVTHVHRNVQAARAEVAHTQAFHTLAQPDMECALTMHTCLG